MCREEIITHLRNTHVIRCRGTVSICERRLCGVLDCNYYMRLLFLTIRFYRGGSGETALAWTETDFSFEPQRKYKIRFSLFNICTTEISIITGLRSCVPL